MENNKYLTNTMTDSEAKEIIKLLVSKCDSDPKVVAQFIYKANELVERINRCLKEDKSLDYRNVPSELLKGYEVLEEDFEVGNIFYDCKIWPYIKRNKQFTCEQIVLVNEFIQKYILENKKLNVILCEPPYSHFDRVFEFIDEKYQAQVVSVVLENATKKQLSEFLDCLYEHYNYHKKTVKDISTVENIKNKIKDFSPKDWLNFLDFSSRMKYENSEDQAQIDNINKEVADWIFNDIVKNKNKSLCEKIILSLGWYVNVEGLKKSKPKSLYPMVEYFDFQELFKTYIDLSTKEEFKKLIKKLTTKEIDDTHYSNPYDSDYLC